MALIVKGVQEAPASNRRGVDVEAPTTSSRGIQEHEAIRQYRSALLAAHGVGCPLPDAHETAFEEFCRGGLSWGNERRTGCTESARETRLFRCGSYRDLSSSEVAYVTTASGPAMVVLGV